MMLGAVRAIREFRLALTLVEMVAVGALLFLKIMGLSNAARLYMASSYSDAVESLSLSLSLFIKNLIKFKTIIATKDQSKSKSKSKKSLELS